MSSRRLVLNELGAWGRCAAALAVLFVAGCATVTPETRGNHAEAYWADIESQTAQILSGREALGLQDCVDIALERSLRLRIAKTDAQIARLEQEIAFANFLPSVQASASITEWDPAMPRRGEALRDFKLESQTPIIVPATWFLYSMRRHGAEMGRLVAEYTEQMIRLEVTTGYYQRLSLAETERVLRSHAKSAQALAAELGALHAEGLAPDWQLKQVQALVLAREAALRENARSQRKSKGALLNTLGLYPLAELALEPDVDLPPIEGAVEDLVLRGLLSHPELHMADRQVAIAQDRAKLAIAAALPKLIGFSSLTGSADASAMNPNMFLSGISGVLSAFNGYGTLQEYKETRQMKKKAFIEREERCLSVMAQVLGASLGMQTARDYLNVTAHFLDAAETRLAEVMAQAEEGVALPSERLSRMAERDEAEVRHINTKYQHQLSMAMLRAVMGVSRVEKEGM